MDQTGSSSTNGIASRPALRLVFLTVGIIVFLLAAWVGRVIVMLLLAAVVFAVLLSAIVDWVTTKLKIRRGLAFALLLAAGFVVASLALWIRGPSIIEQFADLQNDLPQAAHKFLERLNGYQWSRWLLAQWSDYTQTSGNISSALSRIGGFVLSTASIIGGLGLVLFLGLYLAAEPQVYLSGIRRFVPKSDRTIFEACVASAARVLRWWLISQMFSMIAVGTIVTVGLWALGVPLAGTLGIIAALLTFIPNVGPILSVVPAVLLAVVISPIKGFLVILLFLLVHFLEGNVITPLLERKIVRLPPALTMAAQLFLAVIAGPLGLALAAPLTAIAIGTFQVLLPDDRSPSPPSLPT
jgi:predicted PurR-regulated permease PerM